MIVTVKMPFPISTNDIWAPGVNRKTGKPYIYQTPAYTKWKLAAGLMINAQRPEKIKGHFTTTITLDERQRNLDGDNGIKCLLDALQSVGVIENDKWSDKTTVQWGEADGCSVQLVKV